MTILFIHDHPFYSSQEIIYSGGGLPSIIWKNYLINFDKVIVYGRFSDNEKDKKVESSTKNVSFFLTKNYSATTDVIKNHSKIKQELKILIDKADVILVRLPSVLGFIAGNLAYKMNKMVWVEQVGNAKEALGSHGSLLGKVSAPFFEYQNKNIVKRADFVSYVTENKLQKDYPTRPQAITVSLSDVIINSILEKQGLKQERFSGNIFRIGLIGGFDAKYKGQDVLLTAISLLEENIKENIKISLVGKGDFSWILDLSKSLNLIENIEYIGGLEAGNQINDFLSTLSLYVQPSFTEGMPRATIEAMAMGCPVIGSNVGGIPDIVSKKFVHQRGNAQELSNHIKQLYLDREILIQESTSSLKKAVPYLKENLDKKRKEFYSLMNERLIDE